MSWKNFQETRVGNGQLTQDKFHLQKYSAPMNKTFAQNKHYFDFWVYIGRSQIRCDLPDHKIWIHSPVRHWDSHLYIHESNQWRYNLCDGTTWCLVWHNWSQSQGTGWTLLMIRSLFAHVFVKCVGLLFLLLLIENNNLNRQLYDS